MDQGSLLVGQSVQEIRRDEGLGTTRPENGTDHAIPMAAF